jgi:hypothetical protein
MYLKKQVKIWSYQLQGYTKYPQFECEFNSLPLCLERLMSLPRSSYASSFSGRFEP